MRVMRTRRKKVPLFMRIKISRKINKGMRLHFNYIQYIFNLHFQITKLKFFVKYSNHVKENCNLILVIVEFILMLEKGFATNKRYLDTRVKSSDILM